MNVFSMALGFGRHKITQLLTRKKAVPLGENVAAPDFSIQDENRQIHRLSEYRGKRVVLWFYLRASTPG